MDLTYYRAHARMLGYKYIAVDEDMSVWGYQYKPNLEPDDNEWLPDRDKERAYYDTRHKLGYTDEKHLVWTEEMYTTG